MKLIKTPFILVIIFLLFDSCQSNSGTLNVDEKATYLVSERTISGNLPFSDAVIYDNVIYLSGKIGVTIENKLAEGGIGPETKQALTRIKEFLEANGSSMDHVIKCTCMLADMQEWGAMNEEYIKFFPNNKPARSAFGASSLARNARVEIECIAYLSNQQQQ